MSIFSITNTLGQEPVLLFSISCHLCWNNGSWYRYPEWYFLIVVSVWCLGKSFLHSERLHFPSWRRCCAESLTRLTDTALALANSNTSLGLPPPSITVLIQQWLLVKIEKCTIYCYYLYKARKEDWFIFLFFSATRRCGTFEITQLSQPHPRIYTETFTADVCI